MTPWFLGNSRGLGWDWPTGWLMGIVPLVILPLMIWSVIGMGLALWHAARRGEKWWFVLFLFVHTAGILEILYLVFVVKLFASAKTPQKKKRS